MNLFYNPYSQHSRRVIALLDQENIPYQKTLVNLMKGEHVSDEYLEINANHQVPTLEDEGFKIYESNAILRYLSLKYQLTEWYPESLKDRALVEQWLDWNQCQLSPNVVDIVLNSVFLGEDGDKLAVERGLQSLPGVVAVLETRLWESDYVVGDTPTIADLSIASNFFQLNFAKAFPDSVPVKRWFDKICSLPGFQSAVAEIQQ